MKTRTEKNIEHIKNVRRNKTFKNKEIRKFYLDKKQQLRLTYNIIQSSYNIDETVTRKGIKKFIDSLGLKQSYISHYYKKEDDGLNIIFRFHSAIICTLDNTEIFGQYINKELKSGTYTIQELINMGFSETTLFNHFYSVHSQELISKRTKEIQELINKERVKLYNKCYKDKSTGRKKVNKKRHFRR